LLIDTVSNEKELPEQWKKSIILPVYKKGDKTDCRNYLGLSFLSTTYKVLSNILQSRLTLYAEKINGDNLCSATDYIFCIHQIRKIKWECNEALQQLFTSFKEAYDSVMWKVFYNILILFGIPMKLVMLIIMHLNETTQPE